MRKVLLIALIILLCSVSFVYSAGLFEVRARGGSTEGRLYLLSRNSMNNKNRALNLNNAVTYTTGTTGLGATFDASSPAFALVRLVDTLYKEGQPADKLYLKITSENGWCFINEKNPSYKRPFGINAFKYTRTLNNNDVYQDYTSAQSVTVSTVGSVEQDGSGCYLVELTLGEKVVGTTYSYVFSNPVSEMDICIKLPTAPAGLPDGYYYADLHYEISDAEGNSTYYVEHTVENKNIVDTGHPTLSGDFRVWGYMGTNQGTNTSSYNFNVEETPNTYSMNLKQQDEYYDVANVTFAYAEVVDSEPTQTQRTNNAKKYKIYISPGESYKTTTYTANDYSFKKLDTEGKTRTDENTVYYSLYKDKQGTQFTQYANHPYVYELTPTYDPKSLVDVSAQAYINWFTQDINVEKWANIWDLKQTVFLKVNDTSLSKEHLSGLYSSYLYFTLVVN